MTLIHKFIALSVSTALATSLFSPTLNARSEKPSEEVLEQSQQVQKAPEKMMARPTNALFSASERTMISSHFQQSHPRQTKSKKPKKLPKGLQKKYQRTGQLPPGWEKKMQRGEVVPYDVYQIGRPLPVELQRRLPIGPLGSKVLEIEGKIIRVMEKTRVILDVFDLIRS